MQFIKFPTLKEKINHLDLPRNLNLWPMIIKHEQDHPLMCYRSFLQILTKSGHQFWIYRWYTNRIAYSIDNIFVQEWPSCVKYLYTSTTFQTPYESIWRFLLISFIYFQPDIYLTKGKILLVGTYLNSLKYQSVWCYHGSRKHTYRMA